MSATFPAIDPASTIPAALAVLRLELSSRVEALFSTGRVFERLESESIGCELSVAAHMLNSVWSTPVMPLPFS